MKTLFLAAALILGLASSASAQSGQVPQLLAPQTMSQGPNVEMPFDDYGGTRPATQAERGAPLFRLAAFARQVEGANFSTMRLAQALDLLAKGEAIQAEFEAQLSSPRLSPSTRDTLIAGSNALNTRLMPAIQGRITTLLKPLS